MILKIRNSYKKILVVVGFILSGSIFFGVAYTYADYYSWVPQDSSGIASGWRSVAVSDTAEYVVAVQGNSTSAIYYAYNNTWSPYDTGYVREWTSASISSDGRYMLVAPINGPVYLSSNFGGSWGSANLPVSDWVSVAMSGDAQYMIAADRNGGIMKSSNFSVDWSDLTTSFTSGGWSAAVISDDGQTILAGKSNGTLYVTTNGGGTWIQRETASSQDWSSVAMSIDGTHMVASVNGGYVYLSHDQGTTWTPLTSLGIATWSSVSMSDDGEVIAVSSSSAENNAMIFVSSDGGDVWEEEIFTPSGLLSAVSVSGGGNLIGLSSSDDYIYLATDERVPTVKKIYVEQGSGYYNSGDVLNIKVEFSESVTSYGDDIVLNLNNDTSCIFSIDDYSRIGTCNYTVGSEDVSQLRVNSISLLGYIDDYGGNRLVDLSIPSNIDTYDSVVIDTISPNPTFVPDLLSADDTGVSNSDDITSNSTNVRFSVDNCEEQASVSIVVDSSIHSLTTCPLESSVVFSIANLSDGDHTISAFQTDLAGNDSEMSGDLTFTIDTIPPVDESSPSLPGLSAPSDTGISGDGITSDATPTITGSVAAGCSATEGSGGGYTHVFANGSLIGIAPDCTTATYMITATSTLADGTYAVTASFVDIAGNVGDPSDEFSLTIDTVAPHISNVDSVPDYSSAEISWNTNQASNSKVSYGISSGTYTTSTTSPTLTTTHTMNITPLSSETTYYYVVVSSDAAGNTSTSTESTMTTSVAPDITAPVITEITPVLSPTTDTTPTYSFSTDEAGTISYGGSCESNTTEAVFGVNTIVFNALALGTYSDCTITVTDENNNDSNLLSVTTFTIEDEAVVVPTTQRSNNISGSAPRINKVITNIIFPYAYESCTEGDIYDVRTGFRCDYEDRVDVPGCMEGFNYSILTGQLCQEDVKGSNNLPIILPIAPSIVPTVPQHFIFKNNLRFNDVHSDVKELQKFLNQNDFIVSLVGAGSAGKETYYFGPSTRNALIRFQKAYGIVPPVGYFGPKTRDTVNKL